MLILSSINSLHIKVWVRKRRGLDTSVETGPAVSYVPAHMIPLLPALPPVICWVLQDSGNISSHSRWCRGFCGPTCARFLIFFFFFFLTFLIIFSCLSFSHVCSLLVINVRLSNQGLSLISPRSDYLFKLLLIGDSGVGKSCLLLRFAVGFSMPSFLDWFNYMLMSKDNSFNGISVETLLWNVNDTKCLCSLCRMTHTQKVILAQLVWTSK